MFELFIRKKTSQCGGEWSSGNDGCQSVTIKDNGFECWLRRGFFEKKVVKGAVSGNRACAHHLSYFNQKNFFFCEMGIETITARRVQSDSAMRRMGKHGREDGNHEALSRFTLCSLETLNSIGFSASLHVSESDGRFYPNNSFFSRHVFSELGTQ
jgi:hypothetical protein